jgi:hypothetical protein
VILFKEEPNKYKEAGMESDKLLHDLIVDRLRAKFSSQYKEITVGSGDDPDIALGNHGMTVACVEVETEMTIQPVQAERWKGLIGSYPRLILMVPKNSKVKAMDILWKNGIADRVAVGSYEIVITMP